MLTLQANWKLTNKGNRVIGIEVYIVTFPVKLHKHISHISHTMDEKETHKLISYHISDINESPLDTTQILEQ